MPTETMLQAPQLRPADTTDLPGIERLLLASNLPLAGVTEALGDFFVAERDGHILGAVGLEICCREFALLRSTAVEPEWRGRGLGRRLVEYAIASAEARGIRALYLLTTTAERYFPSFGFVRIERDAVPAAVRSTAEFREACPASATVMSLTLAGRGA